ncbi:MAG: phosphoenolpyruvate--protein phosphotransferase, partial [Geminicoccaceae bacterium]|nr:phosphoenolpyruvate--protein phosphotransferase [Geminicoccaceae bacterium]
AWLHAPKIEVANLLSDDPALEISRLELAVTGMRDALDRMMDRSDLAAGDQREVLEAYRMFAHDSGWFRRIREAIGTGLSAEAAVRRVQEMTELRLGHASDPYLRERLLDLDDLADRLLMHLAGRDRAREAHALPPNSIIVARNLSAADLIEYDRTRIRGIVLEEGSSTAHLTVVARAFDVPVLGRVERALRLIHNGDLVALDGETGQAFLRPTEDVVEAFRQSIAVRAASRRMFEAHKNEPSVTADGLHVALELNAAFVLDLAELDRVAAEGVGLYRTELAYMTRSTFPTITEQASHYGRILDLAGARPVTFRTLDIGSDKQVPYWHIPEEENPAMGWRALRMMLDRPWILRAQLRALLTAAAGRRLRLMFPMVAEVAEFDRARHLLDLELARGRARGQQAPATLEVGAMMEVPALFWQLPALLPRIDFVSVGSNDLLQFLFACDRGSPLLSERYDVLSPPALSFVRALAQQCTSAGVGLSVCGEMASRPIEAMALIGLGVRRLSLSPAQIGPVKAMLRSLDAGALASYLGGLLSLPDHSLRQRLGAWARDHSVDLPSTFARN